MHVYLDTWNISAYTCIYLSNFEYFGVFLKQISGNSPDFQFFICSDAFEYSRRRAPKAVKVGFQLDGCRYLMTKKQRVFAPEEGTNVTRLGNIACITNAGRRFWETGSRKLDEHVTLYGRAVDYARRGSLLEACWEINR